MKKELSMQDLGFLLSVLAKRKKLTQDMIAKACGISRMTVNRLFHGKSEIRSGDLLQILALVDIHVAEQLQKEVQQDVAVSPSQVIQLAFQIFSQLDTKVQATLFEQIIWWAKNQAIEKNDQHLEEQAKKLQMQCFMEEHKHEYL